MCNLAKSRALVFIYLIYIFFGYGKVRVLGFGLGLITPTCRTNLVLIAIWQCDIFGMTPAVTDAWV